MKKGISPLIATVLIIGFTVSLAAVIMTWGSSFVKNLQEETKLSADRSMACTQATFEIKAAFTYGTTLAAVVEGTGRQDIKSFIIRVSGKKGKGTVQSSQGISRNGIGKVAINYNLGEVGLAKQIEMLPILQDEKGEFDCLKEISVVKPTKFDESIMAAYTLDEAYVSGQNILDSNGAGPEGTLDAPTFDNTGGYDGSGAFQFGGDDKITIPGGSLDFNKGFTLTAWVKRLSSVDKQVVVDNGKFRLEIKSVGSGNFKSWFTITDTQGTPYVRTSGQYSNPQNDWIYLAIVYDGDAASPGLKIYVNKATQVKEEEVILNPGATFDANSGTFYIGAPTSSGTYLNGFVDEILIYNKVLAANEIEFPQY